jgi:flagellar hook assembly protein FlgD
MATNDLLMVVDPFNLAQPNFLLKAESELNSGSIWDNTGLKHDKKNAFAASVYPNPVSKNTTISLDLEKSQNVTISLFDMIGHKVTTIAREQYSAGINEIKYDASSLPKGMYFIQITDGNNSSSIKMVVR